MTKGRRHGSSRALSAKLLALLFPAAIAWIALAQSVSASSLADAAHALKATATAHLHYISAKGSVLLEEGPASGALPGKMRVHFDVGPTLKGNFTIYTTGGTIKGRGVATPHGAGVVESFSGSLTAVGGSGRYTHAHGTAKLFGTFNRHTYALTVQTTGTLAY